ncbi:MAG: hypothetical protein LRS48_01825 [Desulfurococcales archaeon]|nr:hypothetical protein [Desulfurococcales archaeon]
MTLEHHTVKTVKVPEDTCLACLLSPEKLLSTSKYTAFVEKLEDDKYRVRFVWRKFGITKKFDVVFRVIRRGDVVEYRSTEESDYPFLIRFKVTRLNNEVEVDVYSEMKAGLMADLFGRKDYAGFIEELIDTGLVELLKTVRKDRKTVEASKISCNTCILYDPKRKYCYYLRREVRDPENPPCKGEAYLSDIALESE